MKSVFADTSFFVALLVPKDVHHLASTALMRSLTGRILTTDWILIETANFLASSKIRNRVPGFIRELQMDTRLDIAPAAAAGIDEGLRLYEQHRDKQWSLTDCISFLEMRREGIQQALTADHHFEQAGFEILLKSNR